MTDRVHSCKEDFDSKGTVKSCFQTLRCDWKFSRLPLQLGLL